MTGEASEEPTHAGGVVVRVDGAERQFLLVRSSSNPEHWVLPKGHIDPGETADQAALREVREEAGVEAEIAAPLGIDEYEANGERVRALYFAMRFLRSCPADEDRDLRWLSHAEACETASFEGSRQLLEQAGSVRGEPRRA